MPSEFGIDRRRVTVVGVVAAVAVLLYSVLIVQRLLFGVTLIMSVFVVSLLLRLVRALERIAAALEADADAEEGDVRGTAADGSGGGGTVGDDDGAT